MIHVLGLIAAVVMPLWNVPLILGIERRRSSRDISLAWAVGVFACILLMLPAALGSTDPVFKVFSIVNTFLFSAVVFQVIRYR